MKRDWIVFPIIFLLEYLHSVLALDPGCNVCSPGKRSSERSKDVVPLDPASVTHGTGLLLQFSGSHDRNNTGGGADNGDHSEKARGHLGHDGSKNLGWWVFLTLPCHVFDHVEGGSERGGGNLGGEGWVDPGDRHGCGWDEGRDGGHGHSEEEDAELGHCVCDAEESEEIPIQLVHFVWCKNLCSNTNIDNISNYFRVSFPILQLFFALTRKDTER